MGDRHSLKAVWELVAAARTSYGASQMGKITKVL
jgi:hypothetical protein